MKIEIKIILPYANNVLNRNFFFKKEGGEAKEKKQNENKKIHSA